MKENYAPWVVDINSFPKQGNLYDQLKFLINFAILAPSSHNSQPWKFKIENNSILVFPDITRRLPKSDSNNRQLYIGLGCAMANIKIAADFYGYTVGTQYLLRDDCAVKLVLTKTQPQNDKNHLIYAILTRTNNRNKYENRLPSSSILKEFRALSTANTFINIIEDNKTKDMIADVAIGGISEAMSNPAFRSELSYYLKSNLTRSKIGMPGFGMGFPTLISLIAPKLLKNFNMSKITRRKDELLLKKFTPLFIIISTQQDGKASWLDAGEVFENAALIAEKNGLKTGVWASPIQIGEHYMDLQNILKINFRPQMFFRLGYTNKVIPHSPRLSVEEVLVG